MATTVTTSTIVDAIARICADAVAGKVYAAGVTEEVTGQAPMVVPVADDFSEAGMPAVTVAMGPWDPKLQPGNERLTMTLLCAVWRPRVPLGENTTALYGDRDALADAFIAHTKAYQLEPALQSAVLMGGPGIRPRSIPRGQSERLFLTLPFTVEVTTNRQVVPQPD